MSKVFCITHSADLDGHSSGAIVLLKHPEATVIGWNYGEAIPEIPDDHHVIITDISYPMEKMLAMAGKARSFTWIDHHISAIKEYEKYFKGENPLITAVHPEGDERVAACELTWRHLFPNEPAPEVIRLLGAYDCFRHKDTPEEQDVLQFQFAARSKYNTPKECLALFELDKEEVYEMMYEDGKAISGFLKSEALVTLKRAFDVDVEGHKFLCVNAERFNLINFDIDYHKMGYDGSTCFWYNNNQWYFSLYNENGTVDCSVLAKKRGGGGHAAASGFELNDKQFAQFISTKRL